MERQTRLFGIFINQITYAMMYCMGIAVVYVVRLNIKSLVILGVGGVYKPLQVAYKLIYAYTGTGGYGHHRNAQLKGKLLYVYLIPPLFYLVHHIQGNYHGPLQLHKLHGKVKISLKVCSVNYVYYGLGLFPGNIPASHHLLHGVGRKRIYAGKVHQHHVVIMGAEGGVFYASLLFFNGYAGPVANIFPAACHGVEQGGLAAVGIAYQRYANYTIIIIT